MLQLQNNESCYLYNNNIIINMGYEDYALLTMNYAYC